MNRKYKLLYIEDQDPQTCVNLLKEDDMFEVETDSIGESVPL